MVSQKTCSGALLHMPVVMRCLGLAVYHIALDLARQRTTQTGCMPLICTVSRGVFLRPKLFHDHYVAFTWSDTFPLSQIHHQISVDKCLNVGRWSVHYIHIGSQAQGLLHLDRCMHLPMPGSCFAASPLPHWCSLSVEGWGRMACHWRMTQ